MDLERSSRSAINWECTFVSLVDKLIIALVRRSKKAVSEGSGIMYSRAELLGMNIEWEATGGVSTTHESAVECSKDAKIGTGGFVSYVRIDSLLRMPHLPRYPRVVES
jgi:hypothetical protein